MAQSPEWKVYVDDKYQAACKEVEAAAALCAFYGDGSEIRWQHETKPMWAEGKESQPAGESYDFVAQTAFDRKREMFEMAYNRATGRVLTRA